MGEKQSRPVAVAGGDASAISKESEAPEGSQQATSSEAADAVPQQPPPSVEDNLAEDAVPSESEILARLISNLSLCPGRSMALAEIRERLPPALRRLAEDTDSICKWLRGFPGLFEVSGEPGDEQIMLTVGRLPRPGGSGDPSASTTGAPPGSAAPGGEATGASAREAVAATLGRASTADDSSALAGDGGVGLTDEDGLSPSTVQLRGLPFRATIADIKAFLGDHANHLVTAEPAIRLLLNRDGRPSGFARVQFTTTQAAQACREALHRQPMGDRYVEVLACSDRAGKARHRRATEAEAVATAVPADGAAEYLERERVLQECQEHMRMPGRNQLLLSMLGIALSPPARAYLRRANLGLKHFLARFPNEFRVEGPKGCERVIWCGAGAAASLPGADTGDTASAAPLADASGTWWPGPAPAREPSTPKLAHSSSKAGLSHSGHCVRTPSDWGTPGPIPSQQAAAAPEAQGPADAGAAPGMDFNTWPTYGWPPVWAGQAWMPWQADAAAGVADGGIPKAARGQAMPASGKRGARGDSSASRSHAHLHPQSHPFANRPVAGNSAGSATAPSPADSEGRGQAVPALRLRGLPFNVTLQDVLAFFAQHEVADRIADGPQAAQLLPKANGRPSGQAVVQMRSRYDAEVACSALYHQFIGGRYIEVFVYGDATDSQGPDAGAPQALPGAPAWPLPPWAGVVPPPVPGTGGEARDGETWGQIFNWLWHGQEQLPDMSILTAVGGPPVPTAASPGAAPLPASGLALSASVDAPARTTLQV